MLPTETTHYVPKVRAVIHIYNNLDKYGFNLPNEGDLFANTKEITIKHSYKVSNIARQAGLSVEQFRALNPDLIGSYIPRMNKGIQLRVPNKHFDLAAIKKESTNHFIEESNNETYKVRRGDTLYSIARKHKTTIAKLIQANGLSQKSKLRLGQSIKLQNSIHLTNQRDIASSAPITIHSQTYTVKTGDNLSVIAKKHNLSIADLKSRNNLNRNTVFVGQKLNISKISQIQNKSNNTYRVQRGDNLERIARKFKTNKANLMSANGLNSSKIYPGQKLIINNEI
jgi:membrane-bound lytic murein transglycosylase D